MCVSSQHFSKEVGWIEITKKGASKLVIVQFQSLTEMNGPQRTACLAKGYIDSEFARYLVATVSQNSQLTGYIIVNLKWRTRYGTHTHMDNMQFLGTDHNLL